MMVKSRRNEVVVAYALMTPFIIVYGVIFVWPSIKLFELSFTDAPLIGEGAWVGFKNYWRLQSDRLFSTAIWNTVYFVALSVVPEHAYRARHRARRQPAQGAAAERRARRVLSPLHPAGLGGDSASGAGCSIRTSASPNTSLLR